MSDRTSEDVPAFAADWRSRATITVDEYRKIVGVARGTAYAEISAGKVAHIRHGRRILVCVPALLQRLNGET